MTEISLSRLGYHQQEEENYCGPASVQMVLHSTAVGISILHPDIQQYYLFNDIRARTSTSPGGLNWAAPPEGMVASLDAMNSTFGHYNGTFSLFVCPSVASATRLLMWNVERFGVGGIALAYEYRHWVVVRGYTATRRTTGPSDDPGLITLEVSDPYPAKIPGSAGPPPHADGDVCGDDKKHGTEIKSIISIDWETDFMVPIPAAAQTSWTGKCLVICDSRVTQLPQTVVAAPLAAASKPLVPGIGPTDAQGARQVAVAGLALLTATDGTEWTKLNGVQNPRQPYQVFRLDRPGSYFLVPVGSNGASPVAVMVSADTGDFLQAVAVPNLAEDALALIDRDAILGEIVARQRRLNGRLIQPENLPAAQPLRLVWRPCDQSLSPFYPFYETRIRFDGVEFTAYVRAYDAQPFFQLTSDLAGL